MNFAGLRQLALADQLYPALIFYGLDAPGRQQRATELARILLCAAPEGRPCGTCVHCRRITWPTTGEDKFHPDFHVLTRDLRTATSADATKNFLHAAYSTPFEARGQVFAISEADTLTAEAADALLKVLEEPPLSSPRHFILLTPSRLDLLPTLRSRSLSVFLGEPTRLDADEVQSLAQAFGRSWQEFAREKLPLHLLTAADVLATAAGYDDPRARQPWATAAAAVLRHLEQTDLDPSARRCLLDLAAALLDAPRWRVRGISHNRILEGLLSQHLAKAG